MGIVQDPPQATSRGGLMENDGPDRHFGRPGRGRSLPGLSCYCTPLVSMHAFGRAENPSGSLEAAKLCASSTYDAQ